MATHRRRFKFTNTTTSSTPEYTIFDHRNGNSIGRIESYGHLRRPRIIISTIIALSVPELYEICDKAQSIPNRKARKK